MTRTERKRSEADIYHIVNRGAGRQIIFENDSDRRRLLSLLEQAVSKLNIELLCWCLMSNHFHLLLKGDLDSLSAAMRLCCGTYAKYFNATHGRTGHLFQERFRSEPINDDAYLMTVVRYIHQNPLSAGLVDSCDYPWSSYRWYKDGRGPCACSSDFVLEVFGGRDAFLQEHDKPSGECLCLEDVPKCQGTLAMPDERALDIAREIIGRNSPETLKSWERQKRDAALKSLYSAGISLRQIERITGIGRSSIARAIKCN